MMQQIFSDSGGDGTENRHLTLTRRHFVAGAAAVVLGTPKNALAAFPAMKPSGTENFDHSALDRLLKSHIQPDGQGYNQVDYTSLQARTSQLEAVVSSMIAADPRRLSRQNAHAYWINLYNAVTLLVVVRHWPVKSIKKINLGGNGIFGSGPWKAKLMTIAGQELSLDDIEHEIVRPMFKDPLSHYGLNCASYSCPNLMTKAFTGENVGRLLAENARNYVNHRRGVFVDGGQITASKIYSWYADDFGGKGKLKDHWLAFAAPKKAKKVAAARLGNFTYDWSINDIRS